MKSTKYHVEKVSLKCVAIEKGQHGGVIVNQGRKFHFNGILKNGKFPLWVRPAEEFESAFSKLSESEQDRYIEAAKNKSVQPAAPAQAAPAFDEKALRESIRAEVVADLKASLKDEVLSELMADMAKDAEAKEKPAKPAKKGSSKKDADIV